MNFEETLLASTRYSPKPLSWVDWLGNSVGVSTGVTATEFSREDIDLVIRGKKLGDPAMLRFRDPACFRAGEVHEHYAQWQEIVGDRPSTEQQQTLKWIREKVSIFEYFQPFTGSFKGKHYSSDRPPSEHFKNTVM